MYDLNIAKSSAQTELEAPRLKISTTKPLKSSLFSRCFSLNCATIRFKINGKIWLKSASLASVSILKQPPGLTPDVRRVVLMFPMHLRFD